MAQTDPSFELKDVLPPEPYLPHQTFPVWGWFAISAGIIVLALLVILVGRMMRRTPAKLAGDVRAAAYRQAADALGSVTPDHRIGEAATIVSSALRRYLSRVSDDPALYETHEEFVARHQVLSLYPENLREAASTMFGELARLKYGKNATGDPAELASAARDLLDQFHSVRPAAPAPPAPATPPPLPVVASSK